MSDFKIILPDGSIRDGELCLVYTVGGVTLRTVWDSKNPTYLGYCKLPKVSEEVKQLERSLVCYSL